MMKAAIDRVAAVVAIAALVAVSVSTPVQSAPTSVNGINVEASLAYDDTEIDFTPGVAFDEVDAFGSVSVIDWTTFTAGASGTEVTVLADGRNLDYTSDLADYRVLNRISTPGVDSPVRFDGILSGTVLGGAVAGGTALFSSPGGIVWGPASTTVGMSVPGAVAAVAGDGSGDATVSWAAFTSFSVTVTGYRIAQRAAGGTWTTAIDDTGSTATSATISGLTNGTSYEFRVQALGHISSDASLSGETPPSAASGPVTPSAPPTASVSVAPGQSGLTNVVPIDFVAEFSEAVGDLTVGDLSFGGDVTVDTATVTRSSPSTFDVSVTAVAGDGNLSVAIPAGATQAAAGNMQPNAASSTAMVEVDTTAPVITIDQAPSQTDPAESLPVTFSIEVSEPVDDLTSSDVVTSAGIGTLTGTGSSYVYSVDGVTSASPIVISIVDGAATDGAGNTSTTTVVDDQVDPGVPAAPASVVAVPSDATATVSWSVPADGGSEVSSYRVESSTDGGVTWTSAVAVAAPATTTEVDDLANDLGIQFRVVATNAVGDSAPSEPSASVTPLLAPGVSVDAPTATSVSPIVIGITFSNDVSGFDVADIVIGGSTAAGAPQLSGSGADYVLTLEPIVGGAITVDVPAGVAVDVNGTPNTASATAMIDFEAVAAVDGPSPVTGLAVATRVSS